MKTCNCGRHMMLKQNRVNKRIFWGCPEYPQCRHTETIPDHRQDAATTKYEKELRKRLQNEVDEEERIKTELRQSKVELVENKKELISSYCTQMLLFNLLLTMKFSLSKINEKLTGVPVLD